MYYTYSRKMKPIEMATIEKPQKQLLAPGTYPTQVTAVVFCGTHRGFEGQGSIHKYIMQHEVLGKTKPIGDKHVPENLAHWVAVKIGNNGEPRLFDSGKVRDYFEVMMGRKFVRGEKFDPSEVLGKKCYSKIEHDTKNGGETYAKITKNFELPDLPGGVDLPEANGPSYVYDVDKPDENVDLLAPYMIKQINNSDERRSKPIKQEVTKEPVKQEVTNEPVKEEVIDDPF